MQPLFLIKDYYMYTWENLRDIVNEFIDKIVVSAPRYLDGKRYQLIDIHYKGVGIIKMQTPEEFEKGFQAKTKQRRQKSA